MFLNQNSLLLLHQIFSFKILLKIHLHEAFSNDLHPLPIIPKKHTYKPSYVKWPIPGNEEAKDIDEGTPREQGNLGKNIPEHWASINSILPFQVSS